LIKTNKKRVIEQTSNYRIPGLHRPTYGIETKIESIPGLEFEQEVGCGLIELRVKS